jgi:hypothetical protein
MIIMSLPAAGLETLIAAAILTQIVALQPGQVCLGPLHDGTGGASFSGGPTAVWRSLRHEPPLARMFMLYG